MGDVLRERERERERERKSKKEKEKEREKKKSTIKRLLQYIGFLFSSHT